MLLPHHREHLRGSGLTDETIEIAELRSVTDPAEAAQIANWSRPSKRLVPAIAFPSFNLDGTKIDLVRLRPDRPIPITEEDGTKKLIKYVQPAGKPQRPYFIRPTLSAIRSRNAMLGFTEGEKKSLAANQWNWPCIGLPGIWAFGIEKGKDRKLRESLQQIHWRKRAVWICFDTDKKRNPDVYHARAELARLLTDAGATVFLIDLPVITGDDGLPVKMGLDDFLMLRYGPDRFRELVMEQVTASRQPPREIGDYRDELEKRRLESVNKPGIHLDISPMGAGKSTASIAALTEVGNSLTILQTHKNCDETEQFFEREQLIAGAYPPLNAETCSNYDEASRAIECGLSPSRAICNQGCPKRDGCEYQDRMEAAGESPHRIATHKRASFGFENLADGRRFIDVHEDPIAVFRRSEEIASGLKEIQQIASHAKHDCLERMEEGAPFYDRLQEAARWLSEQLDQSTETTAIDFGTIKYQAEATKPRDCESKLFRVIKQHGIYPSGSVMRVCLAIAADELESLTVRVDCTLAKGGATVIHKAILAVWLSLPPEDATVWINDATATAEEIREIIRRPIINSTPSGALKQVQNIKQIPLDVKESSAAKTVLSRLRAALALYPNANRIGVICHKKHVPTIKGTAQKGPKLDDESRKRIAKIEHFRSGASRGSNDWIAECDAIVVLGTPRVRPGVIKNRLIIAGRAQAAARDGEWGPTYWSGVTATGRRRTIRTLSYASHAWHAAHAAIVHAELKQAVGRGRAILDKGVPVVVVSTEPLNLPPVDEDPEPINGTAAKVLECLISRQAPLEKGSDNQQTSPLENSSDNHGGELTEPFPKIYYLENGSVSSSAIAEVVGISERATRQYLRQLEQQGLVVREGQRGGWRPTTQLIATGPSPQPDPTN